MDTRPDEAAEWHAARRRRRKLGCLAVLLTPVVLVAILLVWFGFRIFATPNISRNYTAEFNERIEAVPETDRAWPIYMQAALFEIENPKPSSLEDEWPIYPGWSNWGEAEAWLVEMQPALKLVREGAGKPVLGKPMSDVSDQKLAEARAIRAGLVFVPETASENPMLLSVLLEELNILSRFTRTLAADAFRAAEAGDSDLAVRNIEAILGMAAQSPESTFLVSMMSQVAIEGVACQTTAQLLNAYPLVFRDAELLRLQRAFMEIGRDGLPDDGGLTRLTLDMTMGRAFFEDLVQRVYSDNGRGNGYVTIEGLRSEVGDLYWSSELSADDPAGMVAILLFSASRRNILSMHDDYMDQFETIAGQRPWARGKSVTELVDEKFRQMNDDLFAKTRYLLLNNILSALDRASSAFDMADARRDAAITVIALHRYQRTHGSFPESLEALVPGFLPTLPLDPVDGKPLRYVLGDTGPILYSLGGDGDDDGGVDGSLTAESERNIQPGAKTPEDGDWVLYPVAPAEEPVEEDE